MRPAGGDRGRGAGQRPHLPHSHLHPPALPVVERLPRLPVRRRRRLPARPRAHLAAAAGRQRARRARLVPAGAVRVQRVRLPLRLDCRGVHVRTLPGRLSPAAAPPVLHAAAGAERASGASRGGAARLRLPRLGAHGGARGTRARVRAALRAPHADRRLLQRRHGRHDAAAGAARHRRQHGDRHQDL